MKEIWQRIEKWAAENIPQGQTLLNAGAIAEEIAETEQIFGIRFPDEIKESYSLHNGQNPDAPFLIDGRELLSLQRMRDEWQIWKDLLDSGTFGENKALPTSICIKNNWWNPKWIPLTYDGAGNHDCLDLTPNAAGNYGQIIGMWHDESERYLVSTSWRDWLEEIASDLEAGNLVFSDEYFAVVDIDDL
jgi:cell wall assembly regulator SMI1